MPNAQIADNDELSFGVELEFLFYFQVPERLARVGDPEAAQDPNELIIDPAEEARLPPALTLPAEYDFNEDDQGPYDEYTDGDNPRGWANKLVKQAIRSVRGARLNRNPMPADTPKTFESMYVVSDYNDAHSGWSVKMDATAKDAEIKIQGYGWLNFEVTSPALWDRPQSHRHVHQVIQELTARFRLRVNVRTGFHCHVGAGLQTSLATDEPTPAMPTNSHPAGHIDDAEGTPKKHSLGVFRRAAALMWAADGFLSHAHPPDRGFNMYSPPTRFFSRLAWGQKKRLISNGRGGVFSRLEKLDDDDDDTAPFNPPTSNNNNPLPKPALPSHHFPRIDNTRLFPALRTREMDAATKRRYDTMYDSQPLQPKAHGELRNQTVHAGVRHIMRCRNRVEIAELLEGAHGASGYGRANYNLLSYGGGHHVLSTVECREAAGTVSADWVVAWSSVCLGIFRFARDADEGRFWAVVARLAEAEAAALEGPEQPQQQQQQRYDMISLLFDMGLFAEGLFLERKLRADPMGFWFPNRLVEGEEATWHVPVPLVSPGDAKVGGW
jgi:hypothetical protein